MLQEELQKLNDTAINLIKTTVYPNKKIKAVRVVFRALEIGKKINQARLNYQKLIILKLKSLESGIYLNNTHLADLQLRGHRGLPISIFNLYYNKFNKRFTLLDTRNNVNYNFKTEETMTILNKIIELDLV